ncbi:MAG TPA: TonB-dependent receptor [Vicinamibacterales bacterium]|nr:TonB-dependent receptor [Vicinamibacterales bacterium]
MSLQDLLDIQVTTVSRVPEQTMAVPAAVFVITSDDIRRSGATSIPEALRLAPGVQVARINGGTWAIGIRGFADRLARSILVLIDGRAVYSPLFAGTYWENQDTLLEDVDRIEVIRGPGGTLWGANAVNGIINIITKRAKDTQGIYASAGGGSADRGFGAVRYGGTAGAAAYRGYFKALDRGPESHVDGNEYDGWREAQGGFRADWALAEGRSVTVQGDAYDGRLGERPSVTSFAPPFTTSTNLDAPISGGNVLMRLANAPMAANSYQVQVYYDRTNRHEIPVSEDRDTVDVDFQDTLRRWPRHVVTWGAGYRVTTGRITTIGLTAFFPPDRTDNLYTAFAQDEVAIVPNRWQITLGSKFEHNPYSGFEIQPTARLLWTPTTAQTVWAAVTRAVRTPSRVETDYTTTSLASPAVPAFVRLLPNEAFVPEELVAYEAGYRIRPVERLYVTASAFYNDLQHTLSTELLTPFVETTPPPTRLILPVDFANGLHGNSQGVEFTGDARPAGWWRLTGNYSYVFVAMSRNPGGADVSQEKHYEGAIPHHQVQLGTSFDVGRQWALDWMFRYVSALPAQSVPSYNASDVRIAWRPQPSWELALVVQDLFAAQHLEWPSGAGANIDIGRSVYARVSLKR